MKPKPKLEILPSLPHDCDPAALDAFHEDRVQHALARFSQTPGLFARYVERARSRFQKAGERAILEHWIAFYDSGQRLIAARTEMERTKAEYLQLAHEHEVKAMEKQANIAKLEADIEEHNLRRDKAVYQRQHLEAHIEGQQSGESDQKLNEAFRRRQLDARWELSESLSALNTLLELQRWRRQQRDRILKDRKLTPDEQNESLQFVDDLYQQKRAELKGDTRIVEEP